MGRIDPVSKSETQKSIHNIYKVPTLDWDSPLLQGNTESNGTHRSCIKIGGTEVHNIYNAPTLDWGSPPLQGNIESNGTHRSCIKIGDTQVHNIYNAPTLDWGSPPLQVVNPPAVVIGDFNSHHTE
ncbi:hypothetical protein ElyMa_003315600 [Elysia marginata]|uniref:Endonuclease/exonuclease/phosphatase domain-containing protein n=1 Tax=Elysia marginata TaxID=1093978 RepID=A0AAV4JCL0_9GAST|nr:hypothetical protein ElyMa_003315600 [Elysia marginata]